MKKYSHKTGTLKDLRDYREYDRTKDVVPMMGAHSAIVVQSIKNDLIAGKPIRKPVVLTIFRQLGKIFGLITEGNHRITSCVEAGLPDDYKLKVAVKEVNSLDGFSEKRKSKFKEI